MRPIAIVDLETTGLNPLVHSICEIGCVKVDPETFELIGEFETKVWVAPWLPSEADALRINGYDPDDWCNAPSVELALKELSQFLSGCIVGGHNSQFWAFLRSWYSICRMPLPDVDYRLLDTVSLAWPLVHAGLIEKPSLDELCRYFGLAFKERHRALADARMAAEVFRRLMATLKVAKE